MRIIAGAWRGRTLAAPPGPATRPTADRLRQALFDRLMHAPWAGPARLHQATVLDIFAGTGALGLEALSRGAAHATFIENAPAALATLRANVAACSAAPRARILQADALHPPPGTPCDLVFLDPPYDMDLLEPALAALHQANWLAPNALVSIELARAAPLPTLAPRFTAPLADFTAAAARILVVQPAPP